MSVRVRKVVRDLLGNRARTVLVVAAIAIGLIGVSTTVRARAIFTASLEAELAVANLADSIVRTSGAGADAVASVGALAAVAHAEGRLVTFGRVVVGDGLRPLRVDVRDGLAVSGIDRLRPEAGTWPLPAGSIAVERSSLDALGLGIGDIAVVTSAEGVTRELPIAASVYDLTIVSGQLVDQVIFAYADLDTWEGLEPGVGFNQITLTITGDRLDEEHISEVARRAAGEVEAAGLAVLGVNVPSPDRHVLDNVISSLLLILGALGLLSLVLSGFLVFNTVAATLARQRPQIGILKAIGASSRQVLIMYLAMVAAYGAMALAVAIPVGAIAARVLTGRLGTLLNIDVDVVSAPLWVWGVEISSGLVLPVVAALGPILAGTGATVAEVLRGDSVASFGRGRIDRALARLRGLPAAIRYAARNTFRRKLRLVLTVTALSLGGAILVTVLTLRSSLLATIDSVSDYWRQDVTVDLYQPAPAAPLLELAAMTEGVDVAEGWLIASSAVVRADGSLAGEDTTVFGVPPAGAFIQPTLLEGRWLEEGDRQAVVINVDVAANEPDVDLGDSLSLRVQGRVTEWTVVGISTTQLVAPGEPRPDAPIAYVAVRGLGERLGSTDVANRLVVSTTGGSDLAVAAALEDNLTTAGVAVGSVETRSRMRAQVERLTTPILVLLAAMAVVFALVGGLGLLGTMTLNILERTAEIGVVRAVGATGRTVLSIVLVEGLAVATVSWIVGSLLAVPLGWAMGHAVGVAFIKVPLDFAFAPIGVGLWLGMALVLAVVASWLPARNAARLSVKEAIAYE